MSLSAVRSAINSNPLLPNDVLRHVRTFITGLQDTANFNNATKLGPDLEVLVAASYVNAVQSEEHLIGT